MHEFQNSWHHIFGHPLNIQSSLALCYFIGGLGMLLMWFGCAFDELPKLIENIKILGYIKMFDEFHMLIVNTIIEFFHNCLHNANCNMVWAPDESI